MARCDRNETNTQRSNLFELEFKEDSGAFGDATPLFSCAGPPSGSRCWGALAELWCWAQKDAPRSPAHWCTVAHLCSTITEGEPVSPAPSLSQIKPLLLGGRLRSNIKMDAFKCGRWCERSSHVDASPARFDLNMLENFIRHCWLDLSLFLTPGTGGASIVSQVFSTFQSQGNVLKTLNRSVAYLCCRSTPCLRSWCSQIRTRQRSFPLPRTRLWPGARSPRRRTPPPLPPGHLPEDLRENRQTWDEQVQQFHHILPADKKVNKKKSRGFFLLK